MTGRMRRCRGRRRARWPGDGWGAGGVGPAPRRRHAGGRDGGRAGGGARALRAA